MDYLEKIPQPSSSRAFPMNDVVEKRLYKKADDWLEKVENYDREQFITHIDIFGRRSSNMTRASEKTHRSAMDLCRTWDLAEHKKYRMTLFGYQACQSFTNETRLLPPVAIDFSKQLRMMGIEQPNAAREFGKRAWASMEGDETNNGHNNVHQALVKVRQYMLTSFSIYNDVDVEHINAGMSLPYLLSVHSRLVDYSSGVNDFNGMIASQKENIDDQIPFSRYFIKDINPANDPPYEPKK